jgi:hypothetical protein
VFYAKTLLPLSRFSLLDLTMLFLDRPAFRCSKSALPSTISVGLPPYEQTILPGHWHTQRSTEPQERNKTWKFRDRIATTPPCAPSKQKTKSAVHKLA